MTYLERLLKETSAVDDHIDTVLKALLARPNQTPVATHDERVERLLTEVLLGSTCTQLELSVLRRLSLRQYSLTGALVASSERLDRLTKWLIVLTVVLVALTGVLVRQEVLSAVQTNPILMVSHKVGVTPSSYTMPGR